MMSGREGADAMTESPFFQSGPVTVTIADRVAVVRLDRGDRINALSVAAMQALLQAAQKLSGDVRTSAVVLTGVPVFSAGADLGDPEHAARAQAPLMERRELLRLAPDLCSAWEAIDQLTIVAIESFCIGGALALAVACDLRIAGRSAHFRLPEIELGWNMNWNAQPRILNLIGPSRAKRLIIFGDRVTASEAEAWGLVDAVTDDGAALETAMQWAARVGSLPPLGVRMAKRAITQQATALNPLACFMDGDQYMLAALSEDHREALAAWRERRPGVYVGR